MADKTERVEMRVTPEMKKDLKEAADAEGLSVADFIRQTMNRRLSRDSGDG